jgi:NADH dehydrogenase [ubiquinone] 1 alpha subcomplex assembly factor 5
MSAAQNIFDRDLLRVRRDRAAGNFAAHDFLLQRVADDLADRLELIVRHFSLALDLGSHHGVLARRLRELPNVDTVICMDSCTGLLSQYDGLCVQADEEYLPFAARSLDLIVSGLSLQFANDLPGVLLQAGRSLKPDGLLLVALLGGATLHELRTAFTIAEAETVGGASPHIAPFADIRDLGALAQRAGLALPVADAETLTVTYQTPLHLMHELRGMGATNALHDRHRKPLTRRMLLRVADVYKDRFGRADGRIPATFEILTLTAWAPHESQPKPLKPGSARARLADALGVNEQTAGETTGKRQKGGR